MSAFSVRSNFNMSKLSKFDFSDIEHIYVHEKFNFSKCMPNFIIPVKILINFEGSGSIVK